MKNIELEGKFVYLDQLIDKTLRLINKVESSTDGRLEYYKCALVVPLDMDMSQFVQELTDWGMWTLDYGSDDIFFISGVVILNLKYQSEKRTMTIRFTFPKEYRYSKTKFSNSFLNVKFKNSSSWKNRIESYQKRILALYEQSESYYDNPEVVTDLPNAIDYLNELLKG